MKSQVLQPFKQLRRLLVAGGLSLSVLAAAPVTAQTVTLSASSNIPVHLFHKVLMVDWAADVEKVTEGRVKINVLPKPVSTYPRAYDAVRDGLADVAYYVHGAQAGRFGLTQMAELALLGDTSEDISVAYQRIYERHLAKANEHQGVKVLAVNVHGPGAIFNTKRPINSARDLSGLKLRVGSASVTQLAQKLGAVPLHKSSSESYELISTGVADGAFFPAEAIATFKLERFIKYGTLIPGGAYNTSFVFIMNEDAFKKIQKRDQDAIMAISGEKLSRAAGRAWDAEDRRSKAVMQAAGVQTTQASPSLIAEIKAASAETEKAWIAHANSRGLDGAKVLAEFREEIRKVAAGK
ncbi:TRAP transporter substrate-binding protein [Variovorax sp. VNK109]|uniref:TRAP transporter substrate-binding protein n=1 Tax=Variovorax sp. VNK109 TaxID=3400919 RepID=UPI003BFEEDCF